MSVGLPNRSAQNCRIVGWVEQRETQQVPDFVGFRQTQPNLHLHTNSHGIGISQTSRVR